MFGLENMTFQAVWHAKNIMNSLEISLVSFKMLLNCTEMANFNGNVMPFP